MLSPKFKIIPFSKSYNIFKFDSENTKVLRFILNFCVSWQYPDSINFNFKLILLNNYLIDNEVPISANYNIIIISTPYGVLIMPFNLHKNYVYFLMPLEKYYA